MKPQLIAFSLAVLFVGGCSQGLPKAEPYGIRVDGSGKIEDAKKKFGEPTRHYATAEKILSFSIPVTAYFFDSDLSEDGRIEIRTSEDRESGSEYIKRFIIPNPKSPSTLGEVKRLWGKPAAEGNQSTVGGYYLRYEFPASRTGPYGHKVDNVLFVADYDSDKLKEIQWF